MKTEYKEELSLHPLLSGLLLALILIIAFLIFINFGLTLSDTTSFLTAVELFLVVIWWNFRNLNILVTDKYLEFGFGIFSKRFLRKDIVSCKPFDIRFGQYFGIGIRFGLLNNTILYNTRFGKAVRIKIRNHKRDFVITSDNPRKLCSALKK